MAFDARFTLTLLLVLACAARTLAAPSPAERETARSLMVDGDRLRSAGDLQSALARYQAAHAIMNVPTTGLALAETQAALGLLVEARGTALLVTGLPAAETEPGVFVSARRSAAALAVKLEPRVCILETTVTPANAAYSLRIDGSEVPSAARALPFRLNPGTHTLRIAAIGYSTEERELVLREGATERLYVMLEAEPAKQASTPAVRTAPQSARTSVEVKAATEPGDASRLRAAVALSAGGLVLAAGIVTGTWSWMATKRERERCDAAGQCDASRATELSRANTLANVANVTVPLGVLGIAYGLYELLSAPAAAPERARAALQLQLTPHGVLMRGEL